MVNKCVGVIGASSIVGSQLLHSLTQSGWQVVAFSRQPKKNVNKDIEWRRTIPPHSLNPLDFDSALCSTSSPEAISEVNEAIPTWICTAPIWVLPDYFDFLMLHGAKRVVALSSTSLLTKEDSPDPGEQSAVRRLIDGEARLQNWAEEKGVGWIIVRTTMIYGLGKDKNISEIARLIRRWGFFPLLGNGRGMRQPVHAKDVSEACQAAITSPVIKSRAYNLSGGEVLSYKEMVKRIFIALNKNPHFVHIPRWVFRLALFGLHLLPRFRHWSIVMVDRMNTDMLFDHSEAKNSFGISPRPFSLGVKDLPECKRNK